MHYTTSCNTRSSAPEVGQNNCPKYVELTGIINKPLLLHLVGCLYYLYQWCTVKHISDNEIHLLIKYIKSVLWRVAKLLSYIEDARCLKVNALKREADLKNIQKRLDVRLTEHADIHNANAGHGILENCCCLSPQPVTPSKYLIVNILSSSA